ncbi:MAG: ERCC4 domain-containing protein [Syntrophobacteraceae bacterium]
MRILVDSREQAFYSFEHERYGGVRIERAALPTGDYSLPGFEDRVAIERKGLEDLVGCLKGTNRDRFVRELHRGRHFDLFAVVVEGSFDDVRRGQYRSEMKAHAVLQSIITFQVRYRVPFVWAGNRAGAEYVTYSLLEKYLAEIGKCYRAACNEQGGRGCGQSEQEGRK